MGNQESLTLTEHHLRRYYLKLYSTNTGLKAKNCIREQGAIKTKMAAEPNSLILKVPNTSKTDSSWLVENCKLAAATCIIDWLTITFTALVTGFLYHQIVYDAPGEAHSYFTTGAAVALIYSIVFSATHGYGAPRLDRSSLAITRFLSLWTISFTVLATLFFLTQTAEFFSRGWLIFFYVAGLFTMPLSHRVTQLQLERLLSSGLLSRRRLMVVYGPAAQKTGAKTHNLSDLYSQPVAFVQLKAGSSQLGQNVIVDEFKKITDEVQRNSIDDILIVPDTFELGELQGLVKALKVMPVGAHILADGIVGPTPALPVARFGNTFALTITKIPLGPIQKIVKRFIDLTVATASLVLLSPLLVLIFMAVKLDSPGPGIFRQSRRGLDGQEFLILKFRTMTTMEDGESVTQAVPNDPRLTKIGKWLRRLNLDELPQLLNVLWGDMSLVGPRPHAISHDIFYGDMIEGYVQRHKVKPGITGWAQVNGFRGPTADVELMRHRLAHDRYYIENWSLSLDLYIIFMTVFSSCSYRNAL